jgi:4-phospho-D-threonate 3-dehydrogenase / 4-phospho-D-erythronate 3-dehydrogenase
MNEPQQCDYLECLVNSEVRRNGHKFRKSSAFLESTGESPQNWKQLSMSRPRIGLTMGDPAGVGPELILRAINHLELNRSRQLVVFGHLETLQKCGQSTSQALIDVQVVKLADFAKQTVEISTNCPIIVDHDHLDLSAMQVGKVSAACGEAAYQFIQSSIDAAQAGQIAAVTTAPINKEALHAAGHRFPGHTEIFAERAQSDRWCMMQYSPTITCSFVTVHCGYAQVPELLTQQRVLDVIELTASAVQRLRNKKPKLIVCGLNPHAGEHGLFGNREEERIIEPAIAQARALGIDVEGPLPPDTVFLPDRLTKTDAIVCMYHDQGHIPVKALAFDTAVNTTIGLSMVRTSVDHGTAFDIAWKGIAKSDSLFAAVRLATQLANHVDHSLSK